MLLLGVMNGDTKEDAELLAKKTAMLRVFTDENDKMNKSVLDIGGEVLVVSQFTLCADVKRATDRLLTIPQSPMKQRLSMSILLGTSENGVKNVETGVFGAHMQVSLVNNGPVTIIYDTSVWKNNGENNVT